MTDKRIVATIICHGKTTGFYRKRDALNIKHPKRNKSLPIVLSKNEISRILKTIDNPKHRLLLALAYSAGLRDIDLDENTLMVRGGKGRKDRCENYKKGGHYNQTKSLIYLYPQLCPQSDGGSLSKTNRR